MSVETKDLFELENSIRIVRINSSSLETKANYLTDLRNLLLKHQTIYPEITQWFESKVVPGIKDSRRVAYIALLDGKPMGSAILKAGLKSKFCHLYLEPELHGINLGEIFFSIMALDAKRNAEEIHFTLPEGLWNSKSAFFSSFGFKQVEKSLMQYRFFESELRCTASFSEVWQQVLTKLPKLIDSFSESKNNIFNGIILSVQPNYINKIFSGEKSVEIRKVFNKKWIQSPVVFYASHPMRALYGQGKIFDIVHDTPQKIWKFFSNNLGVSEVDFYKYSQSHDRIFALILKDIHKNIAEISLDQLSYWLEESLTPPQSYLSIRNNPLWARAIFIYYFLQLKFDIQTSTFFEKSHLKRLHADENRNTKKNQSKSTAHNDTQYSLF